MRALYLVAAVLLWQIAGWAFAPPAPVAAPKMPVGDGRPHDSLEHLYVEGRAGMRQTAFRALAQPSGSLCAAEGHKTFISGLGEYYYHRQNQTERYPEVHGQLGADYIARQWSGPDDKRIDRLTQEAFSKGYLKPDEFNAVARKMIGTVVKDERVVARGCAG